MEHVLDVLLGRDGRARRDAADERDRRALFLHVRDGYFDADDGGGGGCLDAELAARLVGQVEGAR